MVIIISEERVVLEDMYGGFVCVCGVGWCVGAALQRQKPSISTNFFLGK